MHRLVLALVALAVLAAAPSIASAAAPPRDQYIVVLDRGSDAAKVAGQHRERHGVAVKRVYRHALDGYAARIPSGRLSAIKADSRVAYVERDAEVRASATTQSNATWGLDRTDQRALPLSGSYSYAADGTGVRAYIVDTGIRSTHTDFGGRVSGGYTAIADGRGTSDCNGHGTHVAGTVGGTAYGIAKKVALVPVRVLDCNGSGTTSGVIAGVDWVTNNAVKPAVANMSLGGGASSSLDTAVKNSIGAGISYSLAAGNDGKDACNYSPARVSEGLTIGATSSSDAKSSWSNWGNCVDFFAPGAGITSDYHSSDTATYTMSGTSMAAPHVAGAAALYLQGNTGATPAAVRDFLYAATTKDIVTSSSTTNDHLLFIDASGGTISEPLNAAPISSFTSSCTDLSCSFNGTKSTDSDGTIASYAWNFGDNATGTGATPTHAYAAAGTYTVTLTVTDDDGATSSSSQSVTVTAPSSAPITLSARGYKVKGFQKVDLAWSGATSTSVDIYRDGSKMTTTNNDGAYTDSTNTKGSGTYTYKVCEAGNTTTCSDTVTVVF